MEWTEPKPPIGGESYYNHISLDSPLGKIMIEWKGWKTRQDYSIEIDGSYIGTEYTLDEAKQKALNYLVSKYTELKIFLKVP